MSSTLIHSALTKHKPILRWGLLLLAFSILLLSVVFIVLEIMFLPQTWYPYQSGSLFQALQLEPTKLLGTPNIGIFSREWKIASPTTVKLSFRAKIQNKNLQDIWGFSMPSLKTIWSDSSQGGFLRVQVPVGGDPYLYRSVATPTPISGQRFRVTVQMRARVPITRQGCRGIWLQENGGTYAAQCFPVALSSRWETFSFEWQSPKNAISRSIRAVINDFDGLEFDIRNLKIDWQQTGTWKELTPLEPTGAGIYLDWQGRDKNAIQPYVPLRVDQLWHEYSISAKLQTSTKLTATLFLQLDFQTELQDVRLTTIGENPDARALLSKPFRSQIWFGDPNLAGHSLAALAFLVVLLAPNVWIGLLGLSIGLLGIFFTESRTAWLAAGFGLPLLLWFDLSKNQRSWYLGAISILILLFVLTGGTSFLGRLSTVDQAEVTRQSVWRVAVESIRTNPFSGVTPIDFAQAYEKAYPQNKGSEVKHAHNFWLQMGVRFGVLGLLTALLFTAGIFWFAWYFGLWRGIAFVLPFFSMNVFDYSLDHIGVWVPLFVGLWYFKISKTQNSVSVIPKPT
jgi:O-Antigen ligase